MNAYELTVVLTPGLNSEKLTAAIAAIEKVVKTAKGKVKESEDWGEKTLAYTIKKYDRGIYRYFLLDLPPQGVEVLDSKLKHMPSVLRSLLVRV